MELTDIQPAPVEVFPGTNKTLFTPVYHIKVESRYLSDIEAGSVRCSAYLCAYLLLLLICDALLS